MKTILKAENIGYNAPAIELFVSEKSITILRSISFELLENEILGVSGESGSGKTTLAKILSGIILPSTGKVTYSYNKDWTRTKTKPVQILFQNSSEILNPIRKVGEVLEEALKIRFRGSNNFSELVLNSLRTVGLDESFITRRGYELSGGEQQRVALARVVAVEPEILILDEPFSAQDVESQVNFINFIKKLSIEKKITLIVISHNLNILKLICNRIIILFDGKIVEIGKTHKIFANPESDHTLKLIKAYSINYK
jgi:ABC-type dipeptide/oligopeptide/nickel transport system ATPase subunit